MRRKGGGSDQRRERIGNPTRGRGGIQIKEGRESCKIKGMSGRAKRHLGFRIEDAAADARGTKRLVGAVAQLRPTIGNLWSASQMPGQEQEK
jgi:hypothetical protein